MKSGRGGTPKTNIDQPTPSLMVSNVNVSEHHLGDSTN